MAGKRSRLGLCTLCAFFLILVLGLFLFQRTWTFHSALRDAQSNAAQLERSYEEALNEAADWRNKYDSDMKQAKDALEEKSKTIAALELNIKSLQKTKLQLDVTVAQLEQELAKVKHECEIFSANKTKEAT